MDNEQLKALETEAAAHGDLATAGAARIARGLPATGRAAVELARLHREPVFVHSNEVDEGGPIDPCDEILEEILKEDASLVSFMKDTEEARRDCAAIIEESKALHDED